MADEPFVHTASQTVGPFLHIALADQQMRFAVKPNSPGAIVIRGTVTDGAGAPLPDALVETWQIDNLFARCPTDAEGRFEFVTVKPGGGDGQAPHINVCVLARGLLRHLCTRIYFPDEAEANAADPLLSSIEDEAQRRTLIARAGGIRSRVLAFDIHLQGERQTAFLDV